MHNRLWLVTKKGLFIYDYQNDTCVGAISFNGEVRKVTSMYEDGDGIMWLGTNNGVRRAEMKDGKLVLDYGREDEVGIPRTEVLAVYVNRHNQLYISYADKIVQTDGQREGVTDVKILQKDMISGHTACIIDDKSGNTWMGNNTGIMVINNKTKVSYTYTFPERFFNVCQLNDGNLLWVSSTGLMYFDPRELKSRNQSNKLYISDLGINYNIVEIGKEINGQVILKKPIYLMDELILKHANNSVMFYLSDFTYDQTPNKIEYRLMPVQQE
jgi:ligand-binding sensor domain-containing protein